MDLQIKPVMDAHLAQALDFYGRGALEQAAQICRAGLRKDPRAPATLQLLAVICLAQKQFVEAESLLRQVLSLKPDNPASLNYHGEALLALGQPGQALARFECALALKPDYAAALFGRAGAHMALERHDAALADLDRLVAVSPDWAEAHYNRGLALHKMSRLTDAIASYDRALALKPNLADAINNRAMALKEFRPKQALAELDALLAREPDNVTVLYNRALVLSDLNRHEEAAAGFARVLEVDPANPGAASKRLLANLHCCDWAGWPDKPRRVLSSATDGRAEVSPFECLLLTDSPAEHLACAQRYARTRFAHAAGLAWARSHYSHEKIRIAYVSADFHDHATTHLIADLIEIHDRRRFEIHGISFGPDDKSALRQRIVAAFDHFADVRDLGDGDVTALLRQHEIDIAVDLKGYTLMNRAGIFSRRAAPIQVNYLGFPGTMGAPFMDYLIADPYLVPAEHQAFYTEKIVYLPDSYQVNDRKRPRGEPCSRSEAGLPEHGFVFCCFNANYKITPDVFDTWMRILHRVDGAVLWLLGDNPAVVGNLRREAARRGISEDRLIFAPRLKRARHLGRFSAADLFLDTAPCGAHTTASDALWTGVPVLTCTGQGFAARVACGLLHAARLPELITESERDYEALAVKIATTPDLCTDLRARLSRSRDTCALFDTERFRDHLESAYATMWERWQRGKPAANFAV